MSGSEAEDTLDLGGLERKVGLEKKVGLDREVLDQDEVSGVSDPWMTVGSVERVVTGDAR